MFKSYFSRPALYTSKGKIAGLAYIWDVIDKQLFDVGDKAFLAKGSWARVKGSCPRVGPIWPYRETVLNLGNWTSILPYIYGKY